MTDNTYAQGQGFTDAHDLALAYDAVASLFDLLNDNLTGPEWLAKVARFARCDSVQCVWWPAGRPEFYRADRCGPSSQLGLDKLKRLDKLITRHQWDVPGFVDEWAAGSADSAGKLWRSDRLIICLDRDPAAVILVLEQRHSNAVWRTADRDRLQRILPVIHSSVAVKKRLSWNDDIADLADKVFDEIPRGFVAMMPNGEVVLADRIARELMAEGSLLRLSGGLLEMRDPDLQAELETALRAVEALPQAELEGFAWRKNLSGRAAPDSYLAVTKGFEFDSWRRESTPYNRVAVMVLQNQQLIAPVNEHHLQDYFELTRAQARVVVAVAEGQSAESAAAALKLSVNTVRSHLRSIYAKLGVENRAQMLHRVMCSFSAVRQPR